MRGGSVVASMGGYQVLAAVLPVNSLMLHVIVYLRKDLLYWTANFSIIMILHYRLMSEP
jgi:hypothetical protein